LEALRGLGLQPWIVTPDAAAYRRYRARFVSNERPGHGPAEGVRAALHVCRRPWALILGVDMPGVTSAALQPLLQAAMRSPGRDAYCFRDRSGRRHPFPGLYHRRLREALEGFPVDGSMQDLLDRADAVAMGPDEFPQSMYLQRVLKNVNRPDDR
jgi:molybdopterin-guanine dinucleotide biosynthesis protein A